MKLRFGVGIFASLGALLALAAPARAGRSTQIDILSPNLPALCHLGDASCQSFDVSSTGVYSQAYIYAEGIVSFDGLLPATANAGDISSLGGGTWFAPGFSAGANYNASIFYAANGAGWGFNFYTQDQSIFGTPPDPSDPDDFGQAPALPVMQVFFSENNPLPLYGVNDAVFENFSASLGYDTGYKPPNGALVGFSAMGTTFADQITNALLVGAGSDDSDTVTTFGEYHYANTNPPDTDDQGNQIYDADGNPLYYDLNDPNGTALTTSWGNDAYRDGAGTWEWKRDSSAELPPQSGVPEPAAWMMLVLGFGAVGAAGRRRAPALRIA